MAGILPPDEAAVTFAANVARLCAKGEVTVRVAARMLMSSVLLLASCTAERGEAVRPGMIAIGMGGTRVLWAEIADDPDEISFGLKHRTALEPDCGMLFVWDKDDERSFWMRDCLIDLDLAFLAADGTIINVQTMVVEPPGQTGFRHYRSEKPARYALEMASGWFAQKGIQPGAKLEGLPRKGRS